MAKPVIKLLNISQVLKDFDDKPIKNDDDKEVTLKQVILTYLRLAAQMGLSDSELTEAYEAGFVVGVQNDTIELTSSQYDVIKKLVDKRKFTNGQQEVEVFPSIVVSIQAKRMVDEATILTPNK